MPAKDPSFEIREVPDPDGGIVVVLEIEGQRVARATASADVLDAMEHQLGLARRDVVAKLSDALRSHLRRQLAKVQIGAVRAETPGGLKFLADYVYRDFDDVTTGLVWYDVPASLTGPDAVPPIVRNRMRFEVHRLLTGEGTQARELVDLLDVEE